MRFRSEGAVSSDVSRLRQVSRWPCCIHCQKCLQVATLLHHFFK